MTPRLVDATETISRAQPSTARSAVMATDWTRVQREAELEHRLSQARMRAGGLLALQLPLFSEEQRAELLELASLAAALNTIALRLQQTAPVPFHRWLEVLANEARRQEHWDAEVAYSLRSIARAVGLEPWQPHFGIDSWAA